MSETSQPQGDSLPLSVEQDIDTLCLRFEQAWQAGQRPSIESYLAEAVPEARPALLHELVALEVVYRQRAGETLDLEEYRRRFPDCSTLLGHVLAAANGGPSTGPVTSTAWPAQAPAAARYRPLRPHARGGLGEVQVAEDVELHREVALKRIQDRFAQDPEVCRRFLREAEITGRLEHPGIVPVYGLVRDADGQPCYAMRFIEGQSLLDAIRRFHEADSPGRETPEQRLALRELLGRFLTVCNTVAYAHSRGVLHRDLKPSNVMVGKYGETLVVDWGLAKPFQRGETERAAGEDTLAPTNQTESAEAESHTRQGAVAGTPAYMSPEQAAGDWDRVGAASDIYSLGATLYEILVNQPPIRGANLREVIEKAQQAEWVPARQARTAVPKALEAVCTKAMACKPADRYVAATELADDVARWLADEPVTAYQEPWTAKARRWMRRHRLVVSGGAAGVVVLAISLAVGAALLGATNAELRQRTKDLADEQGRAEAALQAEAKRRKETRGALDAQTSFVLGDLLSRHSGLSENHKRFLREALSAYEQFATETGQDEESRAGVAQAYLRVGRIRTQLGLRAEAEAAYGRAAVLAEQLVADYPETLGYIVLQARVHGEQGELHRHYAKWEAARESHGRGIALQRRLVKVRPDLPEYRYVLALNYSNLASVHNDLHDRKAGRAALEQSVDLLKQLVKERPDVAMYRRGLATSLGNLGSALDKLGERRAARATYDQAITLVKRLTTEDPTEPEYRRIQANIFNDLGVSLRAEGKREEARVVYEETIALREQLVQDFPALPDIRVRLGGSYVNLANVLRDLNRPAESLEWYAKAIATLEQVLSREPRRFLARLYLRNSHSSRARSLGMLTRHAEAVKDWTRAIELNDEPHRAAEFRRERALALARAGEHAQAAEAANELADTKGASRDTLYACARVCSLASGGVKDEGGLREKYAARAVELLRKAVDAGFRDAAQLMKDKDLDPIRGRMGFQQLLRQLGAKVLPTTSPVK